MANKLPVRENTGNSPKLQILKLKNIMIFCHKMSPFLKLETGVSVNVGFPIETVVNHLNWGRDNLWLDSQNIGNLKMKYVWGPCCVP